eukprot:TRINITY_DN48512_c0_g1_i1.p1 TRINITY_DN48512_c0_g1~~TRINITY_DN48512_c0_g1_i1.p1  ORF type:complete len:614 (-),score=116.97 TRINITY_DN48512_c0_g1_i1:52-1845(-)
MASAGGCPAATVPSLSLLTFEFWDDRRYASYMSDEQVFLNAQIYVQPRPSRVTMPGGRYVVVAFDHVEHGLAVQVNLQTGFERHVRIAPPYVVPGAISPADEAVARAKRAEKAVVAATPPGGGHPPHDIVGAAASAAAEADAALAVAAGTVRFQYNDGGWRDYKPNLQQEFMVMVQSVPPPGNALLVCDGKLYQLCGLDACARGQLDGMFQENVRTKTRRRVRAFATNLPAPQQPVHSHAGPRQSVPAAQAAARRVPASSSSAPATSALAGAQFRITLKGRGLEQVAQQAEDVLLKALTKHPREDRVKLPSGDVIENFTKLEVDCAGVHVGQSWMPVELWLPVPAPGSVVLPQELDEDQAHMTSFGRYLLDAEVTAAEGNAPTNEGGARGNGADSDCAICRCDLVDPAQAAQTGNDMSERVFELQCGHAFHGRCLEQWFAQRPRCPTCQVDFGKVVGRQPSVGTMTWRTEKEQIPGHPKARGTLTIDFDFPPGVDGEGTPYEGRKPRCYLPCDTQGILLLHLFKVAFRRRVMFGLGSSMTFGTYRPTFNIHIKTTTRRGAAEHGYPDDTYYERSLGELQANGVKLSDLLERGDLQRR